MGTVFLAEHVLIQRRVAIKVLHSDLARDADVVERFMNEARAAGAIGHPHIVESTDMGFTRDEVPFIVFEYLEGALLTDEIYRVRGMPPRRALRIAAQIASALHAAHTAGIIHRDLKSDNVFLTDKEDASDHVKVLDFGISRFLEAEAGSEDSSNRHLVMGTPEFMAPEQILTPEKVDKRADIYALGVVMYEMLTARRPFDFDEPHRTDERRYTDTDKGLRQKKDVFSLLKLVLFTGQKPVREVRFRVDLNNDPVYLTASQAKLDKTADEFLHAKASKKPRQTTRASAEDRKSASARKGKRNKRSDVPGLEVARREGEDQAIVGARRARFPFYFPTLRYRGSRYAGTEPRIYSIEDERGKKHRAYRLVVSKGVIGEYYGIQGMTWREPPILDDPSEIRRVNGRRLELHYDGSRLRIVAWRTKHAVYWVSNTLTQSLGKDQMLGIAASLRRLGQK